VGAGTALFRTRRAGAARRWLVPVGGLALLHLAHLLGGPAGGERWFAPAGVAFALVAWLGPRALLLVIADALLVALQSYLLGGPGSGPGSTAVLGQAVLEAAEAGAAWWCYHRLGRGARGLGDPHSAIVFLLLVPGLVAALSALGHVVQLGLVGQPPAVIVRAALVWWMSRALGFVAVAPALLTVLTPVLVRHGLARPEPDAGRAAREATAARLGRGDWIEVAGLAAAAGGFSVVAVALFGGTVTLAAWQVAAVPLLLIVWASLRQGLPGGTLVAAAAIVLPLTLLSWFGSARIGPAGFGFQGNLLTEGCLAVLIAASMSWVRASEARYRRVVGHIPVVLYSVRLNPDGPRPSGGPEPPDADLTFVSPAALGMLGCAPEEMLGPYQTWLARVDPRDREVLLAAVAQLHRQSQPVTCEYRLTPGGPGGRERWLRDTLAPRLGPGGRRDGWEGVLNDITESRALAGDLRRTTSMFHALVANLPAGVFFVHGPAGRPILVNTRARQLLGRREESAAEVNNLADIYGLCRPDGRPYPVEELPVYQALRHGATTTRDDIVVRRPDGRRVPLITWAAPIRLGGPGDPDAAVWVFEDLSPLRQSEERYRGLVESLPLGLVQLNEDLQVIHVNPALQTMSGYTPAELHTAAVWQALIHADDLPRLTAAFASALAGGGERLEVRYRTKDGVEKVGYLLCQPQRRGGEVVGITCLLLDVTRERQLEQDLQRSQQAELVGRLTSGVIHDFSNLLTVIVSLADLARDRLPADHPVRPDLERIGEAGEQATDLTRQLVALSRPQRPAVRLVDVNHVVGRLLGLLRRTLPENIEVQSEPAEGLVPVRGDETQLQQVLMNLCLNARDAMPAGGRLTVRTVQEEGGVRLSVRDSGEGMAEAVLARVFDPFFSTKERGSGLGLAVVQQIVNEHGGRVEVASRPGEGARFDVWLPRAD
jgi:PAS domain S-box-containing protein